MFCNFFEIIHRQIQSDKIYNKYFFVNLKKIEVCLNITLSKTRSEIEIRQMLL